MVLDSENIFPGGDPGVPMHINGHYTQITAYVLRDMLDVERLRYFADLREHSMVVMLSVVTINIITSRPAEEIEGFVGATVGKYDKRNIQAVVSGPLSDSLRGRLAISDDERDGYVKNVGIPGDDRETSDYTSVRGSLEYDVTDNVQLYFNTYYFDDVGNPGQRFLGDYPTGPLNGGPNYYVLNNAGTNPSIADPFKISSNTPSENINKSEGVSLDVSWNLGSIEFRSLSAYDDTKFDVINDPDGSSVVNRETTFSMSFETLTQEFQLLSSSVNDLSWVLGVFYYNENSIYDFLFLRDQSTNDVDGNGIVDQNDPRFLISTAIDVDSRSSGVYGQMDYALNDQVELIAGLRYSKDKKGATDAGISFGVEGQPIPPAIFGAVAFREEEWSEITGKLGLNYHVSDDVMLYTSYSKGYKAGGFNLLQVNSYDPEQVDAFESGLKSRWLENRVQMNIAAFYYDYQDKQDLQGFLPPGGTALFEILNAAAATSKGLELEIQAHLTASLFVDLSLGYLNTEFDDFETIDNASPIGGGPRQLSGNVLPFSPEWSAHLGLQYEWDLGRLGSLSARGDYSWSDQQFSNALNRDASNGLAGDGDFVPSYYMINARLQWASTDANWLAQLYVNNLTDETILSNPLVISAITTSATYLAPRTYGLKVEYNF